MDHGFTIGGVRIGGRVLAAPMTGVTDMPTRRAAGETRRALCRDRNGGVRYVSRKAGLMSSGARGR